MARFSNGVGGNYYVEPALPEGVSIASHPMPVSARVRQEPEGYKEVTVDGYKLPLPGWEHLDLYLPGSLAAEGWWSVTEASTGYRIGDSWDTKATTITSALLVLTVQGREQVDAMIAESREAGMPLIKGETWKEAINGTEST